jgi:hypothetical protein
MRSSDAAHEYQHIMFTHHVGDDEFAVGYVLVESKGEWSLDHIEVPSMDFPGTRTRSRSRFATR